MASVISEQLIGLVNHRLKNIEEGNERIMATITELKAEVELLRGIAESTRDALVGVEALRIQVDTLKAQLATSPATQEDLDALDAGLDFIVETLRPTPVPTDPQPAPEPVPETAPAPTE